MPQITYHPYTRRFYSADVSELDFSKGDDHVAHTIIGDFHPEKEFGNGRYEFSAEVMRRAERELQGHPENKKAYQGLSLTSDIASITVSELIGEVLLRQWRDFYAILGVNRVPVPKLQGRVPIAGKFKASAKVPEGVEPTQKKSTYSNATFALWKNVVDLEATLESQIQGEFSPLSFDIDQAAYALTEVENDQIVEAIESFTTSSEASWAAQSGGVSTNNPTEDITPLLDTLQGLNARPKLIATNSLVAGAYLSNSWIKGQMLAPMSQMLGGLYPVPLYPGLQFLIDQKFTNTKATLYDPMGMLLGEGPTVAEEYRAPRASKTGYIIRKFIQPLKASNNFGRTMTSVR